LAGGFGIYLLWIGRSIVRLDRDKVGQEKLAEERERLAEVLADLKDVVKGLRSAVDAQFDSNVDLRTEVSDFKTEMAKELGELRVEVLENRRLRSRNGQGRGH
jgi:hypothetical protein